MNAKQACCIAAIGAIATPLQASITMSIDILDASDPGGPAPAGMVIVDIAVDVSDSDWFMTAGIIGNTFNGAELVYGARNDPNNPGPSFRPPGINNRFVSFGSAAYGRNDAPRFEPAGTVAEPTIAFLGAYLGGPVAILQPDWVNIAYYAFPLPQSGSDPNAPRGHDGWVMRLALDTSAVSIPGADDPAVYRVFAPDEVPSGYEPVFLSDGYGSSLGTIVYGWTGVSSGQNWGLYVPDPPTGLLSIMALLLLTMRRSPLMR